MWHSLSLDCALICPGTFTRPASGVTTNEYPVNIRLWEAYLYLCMANALKLQGSENPTVLIFNTSNSHPFNIWTGWQPRPSVLITFQYIHLLTVPGKGWPRLMPVREWRGKRKSYHIPSGTNADEILVQKPQRTEFCAQKINKQQNPQTFGLLVCTMEILNLLVMKPVTISYLRDELERTLKGAKILDVVKYYC